MVINSKAFAFAAPLLLGACATMPASSPALSDASVQTSVGRTGIIGDIGITPTSIREDSRCPVNVQCASAGRVVVATQLSSPTGNQTQDMTLGVPTAFAGGTITLSDVEPDMYEGQYLSQDSYRLYYTYDAGGYAY